jgi:predicted nucleotidyltransferase
MKLASVEVITQALDAKGVRYIVVGGLAVALHGYSRTTHDVDLVVQLDSQNVLAAFEVLKPLGYKPVIPIKLEQFADPEVRRNWIEQKHMQVLNLVSDQHPETSIDIFVAEPFDFEREYERAYEQELRPGLKLRVVCLDTLIEMKRRAGRDKDLIDMKQLSRIREALCEQD